MKKISICVLLALTLILSACGGGTTAPDPAPAPVAPTAPATDGGTDAPAPTSTPITIRLQGAFGEATDHFFYLPQFIESVYERSGGTVTVVWGAGPEAIPTGELAEALRNNIVELVYVPIAFLTSHVPGLQGHNLTDPNEMRVNGGVEFVDSVLEEALGTRFLSRTQNGSSFVIGVASEIESPSEIDGMIIRATTANAPLAIALGAETVSMGWGDVYSSLERGVIEGVAGSIRDFVDQSLGGMVETLITPGVFTSDASLVISSHIWDQLDEIQREAIMSAAIDWEAASLDYNRQMWNEAVTALEAAGTTILELTGAERDEFIAQAYTVAWEIAAANDPEMTETLRGFTTT